MSSCEADEGFETKVTFCAHIQWFNVTYNPKFGSIMCIGIQLHSDSLPPTN